MGGEVATIAAEAAPFLTGYGAAVLGKVRSDLADATVRAGEKLMELVFRRKKDDSLPDIVVEAVESPDDSAVRGMLEYTIRKALESDAQLLAEVREILANAQPQVTTTITQNVRAGRDAYTAGGDMNIGRRS
jgi:hypothetical protein